MSQTIATLADLLDPVTPEAFFADHHLKRPLHIPGRPDKFASVMGWEALSDLLSRNALWSDASLQLVMDRRTVPPPEYCRPSRGLGGAPAMMADLERVGEWLRRGASLVCNDIDTLTPSLKAVAGALEQGVGGKVQANLYCSWKAHPAFPSHYDTHDVFAVHVAGEKLWRVYQRPVEDPVSHPAYSHGPHCPHDARMGPVSLEVLLKPGDLLYLPRGWYHDALASSAGTMHVAFGLTSVVGLDLVSLLFERAVHDPLFRRTVPHAGRDGAAAVADHLARLGSRLAEYTREAATLEQWNRQVSAFGVPRPDISLPAFLPDAAPEPATPVARRWRRNRSTLKVLQRPQGWLLSDGAKAVPIPPGMGPMVAWVVGRESFAEPDLQAAFPDRDGAALRRLLADLEAMTVVTPD